MKIKRGSIYRDGWGRKWQTVCFDDISGKWLMRLFSCPNYETYFSVDTIKRNFVLTNP